jgi:hypothetical protein
MVFHRKGLIDHARSFQAGHTLKLRSDIKDKANNAVGCEGKPGGYFGQEKKLNIMQALTKNNSQSMKTVVETYIIEETQELIYDNEKLDQWNQLIESLGLQGQKTVVKTDKSPIPFLWMNETLVNVFEELCPRKVMIGVYNKTPIPVEILSLVSLCQKEEYFGKIEVWYNDKSPDPAVIGYRYTKGNSEWELNYYAEKYLIGRWADVKASIAELTEKAKQLFIRRRTNELTLQIKQHERELQDVTLKADAEFGLEDVGRRPISDLPF